MFSEKMGLESGWNCHISLRSDVDLRAKTKQMYSRKWVTKKYSSEKPAAKHFMSASMPENVNECLRSVDLPKFGDHPLLNNTADDSADPLLYNEDNLTAGVGGVGGANGNGGGKETGSSSTSSMLQYDMSNRQELQTLNVLFLHF
ncbi:MAG: hypothetical protein GY696_25405 [Gammaproteobacteria bacterium]|nr:hypothetical protein [Gammaproteobacteria bacterium]